MSPATDAFALLNFAAAGGFLGAAIVGLVRTMLSDYRRLRSSVGLTRYAEQAVAANVDARVDVGRGMPHGFPASIGKLKAAAQALDAVGAFLTHRLQAHASS